MGRVGPDDDTADVTASVGPRSARIISSPDGYTGACPTLPVSIPNVSGSHDGVRSCSA